MELRQAYNYQESASAETFTALVSRRERGGDRPLTIRQAVLQFKNTYSSYKLCSVEQITCNELECIVKSIDYCCTALETGFQLKQYSPQQRFEILPNLKL